MWPGDGLQIINSFSHNLRQVLSVERDEQALRLQRICVQQIVEQAALYIGLAQGPLVPDCQLLKQVFLTLCELALVLKMPVKTPLGELQISFERGERGAQFMACQANELILALFQLVALGNIVERHHRCQDLSVYVVNRSGIDLKVNDAPIGKLIKHL